MKLPQPRLGGFVSSSKRSRRALAVVGADVDFAEYGLSNLLKSTQGLAEKVTVCIAHGGA